MFMLKKLLYIFSLSAFALPAFAAKQADIVISGKVPEACELVARQNGNGQEILDLTLGKTDLLIGDICEKCNAVDGFTVTVQCANGSNGGKNGDVSGLMLDSVSGDEIPFTFTYGGKAVTDSTVTDSDVPVAEFVAKEITISFAANDFLSSSDVYSYKETLRFVITAK